MLFLSYWKLNESLATKRIQEIAEKLTTEGIFPPEGVEIIRWDGTPDGWGIVLWEADEFSQIQQGLAAWRVAAGDEAFFEKTMTAPAAPVQETIAEQAEFLAQFE